jgi:hypothetical protein
LSGSLSNANDAGTYNFTIKAKNSNGTATQAFTLTITKTPNISNITNKTAYVSTAFNASVNANGDPTPSLNIAGLPSGLSFTDNGNGSGTIKGTPLTGSGGTYAVTVSASNSQGTSTSTFMITVNEAPSITSSNTATAIDGNSFNFQVTASGYPGPNFSETGVLPKGIKFTNSTGVFSGTPTAGVTGTFPVTVTAKNSQATVTQSFDLVVQ